MDFPATNVRGAAPARVVRVVCALIERDGRLLVAQRPPGKMLAGKWEFPGGKLEAGETAEAALVREIREELDFEIDVRELLVPVTHHYGEVTIELIPYCCAVKSGEPKPHEHTSVSWCTVEEVGALDLAAADRPVFDYWRARGD